MKGIYPLMSYEIVSSNIAFDCIYNNICRKKRFFFGYGKMQICIFVVASMIDGLIIYALSNGFKVITIIAFQSQMK